LHEALESKNAEVGVMLVDMVGEEEEEMNSNSSSMNLFIREGDTNLTIHFNITHPYHQVRHLDIFTIYMFTLYYLIGTCKSAGIFLFFFFFNPFVRPDLSL
jgi:hypothetical protein